MGIEHARSSCEEIAQAGAATAALEDDDEVLLARAIEVVKKQRQASASLAAAQDAIWAIPKAAQPARSAWSRWAWWGRCRTGGARARGVDRAE